MRITEAYKAFIIGKCILESNRTGHEYYVAAAIVGVLWQLAPNIKPFHKRH